MGGKHVVPGGGELGHPEGPGGGRSPSRPGTAPPAGNAGADALQLRARDASQLLLAAAAEGDVARLRALASGRGRRHRAPPAQFRDAEGSTALMHACRWGRLGAAQALLALGAGVDEANSAGFSPLKLAALGGWPDLVQLLLHARAPVDGGYGTGRSALMVACAGCTDATPAGVGPRPANAPRRSREDVRAGQASCAALLAQGGADLGLTTKQGCTALMVAAEKGRAGAVRALLRARADPRARSNYGWSALHYAAEEGALECCRELLRAGADLEGRAEDGATPLWVAAGRGRAQVCVLLLAGGANVLARGGEHLKTAMEAAEDSGRPGLAAMLREKADGARRQAYERAVERGPKLAYFHK